MSVTTYTAEPLTREQEAAKTKVIIWIRSSVAEARIIEDTARYRYRQVVLMLRRKRGR